MLRNILTIAKNTFRETIRDRILLSAFVVILAIILFTLFIASISLEQSTRMIVDFGVTAIYVLQIFVAIFIGSMLIYKEVERKTFFLILPKPIRTSEIIIGKCLGLTFTTIVVTLLSVAALFAILAFKGEHSFYLPILVSVFLSTLESVLIILISILFSGLTSPILSAIYTVAIFLAGHSSDALRAIFIRSEYPFAQLVAKVGYYIFPNLEKFNIRNDIIYGLLPGPLLFTLTILYALCYIVLVFLLAQLMFKKKDF